MTQADAMHGGVSPTILLDGQVVPCRIVTSQTARKLRIKVKHGDVAVIVPENRKHQEAVAFFEANREWVTKQLVSARRLEKLRRAKRKLGGHLLFQGEPVSVQVIRSERWRAPNRVILENGVVSITCRSGKSAPAVKSLENWLRKQARERIKEHIASISKRVRRIPSRVYVMGQRTKWGNCSTLGNLSFNWRLIMAPDYVLHYIVTHELVHLAIPDHSQRFWLTVQGFCPHANRARQWLAANAHRLTLDLASVLPAQQ